MKTQIKLQYVTNHGFKHLPQTREVTKDNYKGVIADYISQTHDEIEQLQRKWYLNGERDIYCGLDVEIDNTSPLGREIYRYCLNLD